VIFNDVEDESAVNDANGDFNVVRYASSEEDADQKVAIVGFQDGEYAVDFTDIDNGDYEFTFGSTDTEASETAEITVGESDAGADFGESVYTQTAGDIAKVTIELEDTNSGYIQFGSEDAGFVDLLYIEDDNDDGEVTFYVNTRTLGAVRTGAEDDVYHSVDDIVESSVHGNADAEIDLQDEDSNDLAGDHDFEQYLYELDLISDADDAANTQLTRPLQATTYDLAVNGNNVFVVNDDDASELDDKIGLATLELTQPGAIRL
jgi:hypothetical protein